MADRFQFVVDNIGLVSLEGEGPWGVLDLGGSFGVSDAQGKSARPSVDRPVPSPSGAATKPDSNVSWASRTRVEKIVAVANAALASA